MSEMKSKPYKFNGKMFRYDYEHSVVEHIMKADKEAIKDEAEWKEKYGKPLFGIDEDGYIVVGSIGFSPENWENKDIRDEYLYEWSYELDYEIEVECENFVKFG